MYCATLNDSNDFVETKKTNDITEQSTNFCSMYSILSLTLYFVCKRARVSVFVWVCDNKFGCHTCILYRYGMHMLRFFGHLLRIFVIDTLIHLRRQSSFDKWLFKNNKQKKTENFFRLNRPVRQLLLVTCVRYCSEMIDKTYESTTHFEWKFILRWYSMWPIISIAFVSSDYKCFTHLMTTLIRNFNGIYQLKRMKPHNLTFYW